MTDKEDNGFKEVKATLTDVMEKICSGRKKRKNKIQNKT